MEYTVSATMRQGTSIRLVTDASPWGIGGYLLRDGRPMARFVNAPSTWEQHYLKATAGSHTGQQTFEALAAFRQFGGHTRYACMNLGADMMGNQPDDALTIGCTHQTFGRRETLAQPVDPETPIGVEHDFDGIGLVEPASDDAAKRSAQHALAAR